jgi:ElaB/YqjD/DUF883 family membrane-anchored ribosome-binding protein
MATSPRAKSAAKPRRPATANRRKAPSKRRRASASTAGATAGVSRNADSIVSDIETLRDDLVRLTRSVSTLMQTRAVDARDTVTETATDLYDTGVDYMHNAEDQVRGMAGDLTKQVERNPLAAIGIVFGVGYVIGLMRRR